MQVGRHGGNVGILAVHEPGLDLRLRQALVIQVEIQFVNLPVRAVREGNVSRSQSIVYELGHGVRPVIRDIIFGIPVELQRRPAVFHYESKQIFFAWGQERIFQFHHIGDGSLGCCGSWLFRAVLGQF